MRKFIVFSPSYNSDVGGVVCLHKLVHVLNELGCDAYLYPYFENREINRKNFLKPILGTLKSFFRFNFLYKLNPTFNAKLYNLSESEAMSDEWIVIYPETVFGNPLNAKNVVRWLLHFPGFHSSKVYYGVKEFYIRFNSVIKEFNFHGSFLSNNFLPLIHYPLELYNQSEKKSERKGVAYCIRKGYGKIVNQNVNDILIDGKSHAEISQIFRNVEVFISYDPYTAYSRLAAISGCDSIVIPDFGVSKEDWYPDPSDRYGIAYGKENIKEARDTRFNLIEKIHREHQLGFEIVKCFADEANSYFDLNN